MATDPYMAECFLCKRAFQFSQHRYEGRRIPKWDIMVCDNCYRWNWDGLVPSASPHLISHLELQGVEIKLNAKGWIEFPN